MTTKSNIKERCFIMRIHNKVCAVLAAMILAGSFCISGCQDKNESTEKTSPQISTSEEQKSEPDATSSSSEVSQLQGSSQPSETSQQSETSQPQKTAESDVLSCGFEAVFLHDDTYNPDEVSENLFPIIEQKLSSYGINDRNLTLDKLQNEIKVSGKMQVNAEDYDAENAAAKLNDIIDFIRSSVKITFRGGSSPDGSGPVILTNDDIKSAQKKEQSDDSGFKEWVVVLELTDEGREKFAEATKTYLGQQISVWVDNECVTSPTVNSVIANGTAIISGNFESAGADKLAASINYSKTDYSLSEKNRNITLPSAEEYEAALANVPWCFRTKDQKISLGFWTYSVFNYAYEAYNIMQDNPAESDNNFETGIIDGKNVREWIYDKAKKSSLDYLALKKLAEEKHLTLDDTMIDSYKDYFRQIYDMYEYILPELEVTSNSLFKFHVNASFMKNELFTRLYGSRGELEVSDDELKKFFAENYVSYYFIYANLTDYDDNGDEIGISDETKAEYEQRFKKYADMLSSGKTTDDVTEQFKTDFDSDYPPTESTDVIKDELEDNERDQLILDMKEKTALVKEINGRLYLFYRYDTAERAENIKSLDTEDDGEEYISRDTVLYNMKKNDLEEYIQKAVDRLDFETNNDLLKKYSVDYVIGIMQDKNVF